MVTFRPGDTVETLNIRVYGDAKPEENERFRVVLTSPSGATIDDGSAAGLIVDND
jgi:predicted Zn-dependent protease